jgi:hypothetical protein
MKKTVERIMVALFALLIFGFGIGFIALSDRSFSEQENRSLQGFPKFRWDKLADGRFSQEMNEYYADQFPLRDFLVGCKGSVELLLGKGENNGVLLGEDGYIAKRLYNMLCSDETVRKDHDAFDMSHVQSAAQGILNVEQRLDVPFCAMLMGRTVDVAPSAFDYPIHYSNALRDTLSSVLGTADAYVDTISMYRDLFARGEYVYYKTDHHWTTRGAYYGDVAVMESFGMESEILPMDAFTKTVASDSFYGTTWSAGGMKFVGPDRIEFWSIGNEDEFSVVADGKELNGFYNKDYLEKKDKYSAFLDGTHDVVTVSRKNGAERPTLVVFRDSFGSSLAPFLAQHFDLVLLNLSSYRTDYTDVTRYAEEYDADMVLLIYTLENVLEDNRLNKLR